MFRKNLKIIEKEVEQELTKKTPQELAELKKQIGECNKKISETKEEIELFKKQISEVKTASKHQKDLNTFLMLVAELKANKVEAIPPSQTKLVAMQIKYGVTGELQLVELESRIIAKLINDNVEIITGLNNKIKIREEEIKKLEEKIESIKTGKPLEDYVPPQFKA